jgi:group I intron endonuclease
LWSGRKNYRRVGIIQHRMMVRTFIYRILNLINLKAYVGKTIAAKPIDRWYKHKSTARLKTTKNNTYQAVHKAMNKYGFINFKFEVIEVVDGTKKAGLDREKFWIKELGTFGRNGYNLTAGGDGSSGWHHSDKAKRKMSKDRKGKRMGAENSFFGKKHSKETRAQMSKSQTGKKQHLEVVLKRSKLTVKKVRAIRAKYATGNYTTRKLADTYGITISNVMYIVRNKTWKDI